MSPRILCLCLGVFTLSAVGQVSNVNPTPQKVEIKSESFRISPTFKAVSGKRTDKVVRPFRKYVPQRAEGYYLQIDRKGAVVVGYDEAGLRYGLTTLRQILKDSLAQVCNIADWPDVPFRGVVEGFYGTPWSHEARLRQLDFYGENKLNVYLYGPKDDPYHSTPYWRQPYPEKEGRQLQELVNRAKQNGVNFYWAAHPGADIRWNDADRDSLLNKFEMMYRLGVRSFAIFFDDISGEGTRAEKQAELLNYLDNQFVQKKKDVAPLIVCPTEYNRAWVNEKKGYLKTLGEKLNKSVQIMWTGNTVVHCLDKESMDWVNGRIGRKAYIWWNFPVTDYCRDHLMLGPVYGNGTDIASDMAGFVSNPMEHAEASKIALYGIADYTWNMQQYNPNRSWERAIAALLPDNADALKAFASFNEDAGPNGHRFRREESVRLQTQLNAVTSQNERVDILRDACSHLSAACNALLVSSTNASLIKELRPWLLQGCLVANYGLTVCDMHAQANNNSAKSTFETYYQAARSLQSQMYDLENSSVRHPLQPGIKVASKILLPELDKLFSRSVASFNARTLSAYDTVAAYKPYKLESSVAQLSAQPLSIRKNEVAIKPVLEFINWPANAYVAINSDKLVRLAEVHFDLGISDIDDKFRLDVMTGHGWQKINLSDVQHGENAVSSNGKAKGIEAKTMRLTNVSGKEQSVKLNEFIIETE